MHGGILFRMTIGNPRSVELTFRDRTKDFVPLESDTAIFEWPEASSNYQVCRTLVKNLSSKVFLESVY